MYIIHTLYNVYTIHIIYYTIGNVIISKESSIRNQRTGKRRAVTQLGVDHANCLKGGCHYSKSFKID